eukprot:Rhum_TRINITY_DN6961_c0_g2::Rhum_TRINITY_DN6961_c0_g2_i1::g.21357::m.21357
MGRQQPPHRGLRTPPHAECVAAGGALPPSRQPCRRRSEEYLRVVSLGGQGCAAAAAAAREVLRGGQRRRRAAPEPSLAAAAAARPPQTKRMRVEAKGTEEGSGGGWAAYDYGDALASGVPAYPAEVLMPLPAKGGGTRRVA